MTPLLVDTTNTKVQRISVLCMFRNDATYIKEFFAPTMKQVESMYENIAFDYYVIENDSTDDTREALKDLFSEKSSNSKLLLFSLANDFKNIGNGKNYERLHGLAKIRNKLVNNVTPLESDWCLFIDSNIYFKPDILRQMFEHADPTIGMLTPYTQQLFIPEVHGRFMPNLTAPTVLKHYYDTFSFFGADNKTFWPYCGFEKCTFCKRSATANRALVPADVDVADVSACFGGFALIRTEIVNNPLIRWETLSHEVAKDESVCEHFLFCYMLRKLTQKRVVVLQHVDDIYRTI